MVTRCVDPTSPNLTNKKIVSEFGYLAAFSNAGGSYLSDVKKTPNFARFDPLWNFGEAWARCQLLKLYLRPNLWDTFDGHPQCGCWARWIDKKKERKKESSWITSGGLMKKNVHIDDDKPARDSKTLDSGRRSDKELRIVIIASYIVTTVVYNWHENSWLWHKSTVLGFKNMGLIRPPDLYVGPEGLQV